jgi:hypothetical protein
MNLYLGAIVSLMFLAGCLVAVINARERTEQRRRGQIAKTPPSKNEKR